VIPTKRRVFRVSTIRNSILRESLDHKTGFTQSSKVKQKIKISSSVRAKKLNTDDCADCAIYRFTFLRIMCIIEENERL